MSVHYDDIPKSDITLVHGIRCATALRTAIDVACEVDDEHLRRIVADCLDRRLFALEEAKPRLAERDMVHRSGAIRLRKFLPG